MYVQLKAQSIGNNMKTFVFPEWIRTVVRERFGTTTSGAYEEQYTDQAYVYYVTAEDLVCAVWQPPPEDCMFCAIPMPPTP